MTSIPTDSSSLVVRLLAAILIREDSLPSAAAKLTALGLPIDEIAAVVGTCANADGVSQRETIEGLVDLGFSAATITQVTGYPKTSVASVASRYKGKTIGIN